MWETGGRIVQFVHYPNGFSAGSTFNGQVSTVDIGATMLDFAGITAPYDMDGVPWKEAATGDLEETSYFENDRCLFMENEKDRSVRCGCYKYLELYAQDSSVSTTYQRGLNYGTSVDLDNLFDLCGGTSNYITDAEDNQEVTNYVTTATDTVSKD